MAKKASLKDVANEVGLSESAVSQVLNGRPCRISEESKERIREAARRLNYRANQVARGLALRRSNTIGLIVPDIENPFFSSLAKRLEESCRAVGYGLFITNSDDCSDYDCEQLQRLESRGVDGIVFVPSSEIQDGASGGGELVRVLRDLSVPLTMVDRVIEDVECDKVFIDNVLGAQEAVRYLLDHGHTRIGCLAKTHHSQNGRLRLTGYKNALEERGIPFKPELVRECDYHSTSGYQKVGELVEEGVTAVFSTSDLITAGVMNRFVMLGLKVPQDVSLVSFDYNETSAVYLPGITSVRQDVGELATRAFRLLMSRIEGNAAAPSLSIVAPELVVGTSVRAL